MNAGILDPMDRLLIVSLKAARALNGKDKYCIEFIQAYREG